ncbi:MAG: N-acetylmuramoyl-L-alanine amidase [Proteobacteria bacterium]|nr:N-acetylmuramoyl-L-alanine amidase [Pseudomonadota bacterium]
MAGQGAGALIATLLAAVAALTTPATTDAARPGQVAVAEATGWRLGEHDAAQRLVIDLSKPVAFKIFRLSEPDRVVIDMPEIDWRRLEHERPLQGGAVSRVRLGVLKPGTSRIVVDTTAPLKVRNAELLEPRDGAPYRLVIDLEPDGAAPPSAPAAVEPMRPARERAVPAVAPPPVGPKPVPPPVVAVAPPPPLVATAPLPAPPPKVEPPPAPAATRPEPVPEPALSLLPSLAPPALAGPLPPSRSRFESAAVVVPILPAPSAPRATPPAVPRREDTKRVIVIDPGHGGVDPGAVSLRGVFEKTITFDIAQEIERQLTQTGRYTVVLTRTDDSFVRLRQRVAMARQVGADLFISIHADSLSNHAIGGMSIYTLSETASDREAEALAAKENKADIIVGVDLRDESPQVSTILIDLAQRETKNLSAKLARSVIDEIGRDRRLLPKPHRFAGFAVLTAPDVPSVLIELGYLSNRTDEHELLDPGHRQRLARGVQRALDRFFAGRERLRRS